MAKVELPGAVRWSAVGLLIAGLLGGAGYLLNRGSQARLDVSVLKVRTIATGDGASVAVLDLRIENPSRALFQVNEVELVAVAPDGTKTEGMVAAERDLDRVLDYYRLTGPRYSPVLKFKERIRGGETVDRTLAASFNVPAAALDGRRRFEIRIQDADGALVTAEEARGPGR